MIDLIARRETASSGWSFLAAIFMICSSVVETKAGEPPPGFSRLADVAPDIEQDMRYAGSDNFTGNPVPGYRAPDCWLRTEAAQALAAVQAEAQRRGFSLVVYDCYRPQRAVEAFVLWSRNPDQSTKSDYFPHIDKRKLFARGYIAQRSSHSTGLAVDIGVPGWDFGSHFDYFDRSSWTKNRVTPEARRHREALVNVMRRYGFINYPREWWHFTYGDAERAPILDAEID